MNFNPILSLIAICIAVLICFCVCLFTYFKDKIENKYSQLKYIEYDAEKIKNTYNNLIADEFETFSKMHPDYFEPGTTYLKPDDIKDITAIITTRVLSRMTEPLRNNLKFIYNFSNDNDLINIIGESVGILVVGLAASINGSLEEDTIINKK